MAMTYDTLCVLFLHMTLDQGQQVRNRSHPSSDVHQSNLGAPCENTLKYQQMTERHLYIGPNPSQVVNGRETVITK